MEEERKIKTIIDELRAGDNILVSELSRLGRSMLDILQVLSINRTKDKTIHEGQVVSEFLPYMAIEREKKRKYGIISPYFFVYKNGKLPGKRYTHTTLNKIWKTACEKVGESITMYQGTKHSRASQLVNEEKLTLADLQMAGDWASSESVKKYAKVEMATRKNLLEGKVTPLKKPSHEIAPVR